jgi:hypothetical protein
MALVYRSENGWGVACCPTERGVTGERKEMLTRFWWENQKERIHLADLIIDWDNVKMNLTELE